MRYSGTDSPILSHDVCADGDSIHKLAGEKELYVIKPDTTIKLPLLVHGEEI